MITGRVNVQKAILVLIFGSTVVIFFYSLKTPLEYSTTKVEVTEPQLIENVSASSQEKLLRDLEAAQSLPLAFLKTHQHLNLKLNSSCARLPKLFDLQYNNIYWQTLVTSNGTFQLLNAYLDNRRYNKNGSSVRILGMINKIDPDIVTFCQLWYDNQEYPIITESTNYTYLWRKEWQVYKKGEYEAYLISCDTPKNITNVPVAVSLVEKQCDTASNLLKIIYKKVVAKKDFAVCVKGLDYPNVDLTVRLVEWIELLFILGADKIYFYEYNIHPNVKRLLDYYTKQEKIDVTPLQLAGSQPNLPALRSYYLKHNIQRKRINEMIPYNDCFYRYMHEYKYIALLDIDEVIVPKNVNSWKELIEEIKAKVKQEKSSYSAQNLYFLDNLHQKHEWFIGIPRYMHMLQHVYRSVNFTVGQYVKTFFNTEEVLAVHNHYPLTCFNACRMYDIGVEFAQLQHYRSDCVDDLKQKCSNIKNNLVMDTNIWRYKETLMTKVYDTLKNLKIL